MENGVITELAAELRRPQTIGDVIAAPTDWTLHDPRTLIKAGPTAEALKVYSLGALRDYLTANRDTLTLETLVVHVVSPQVVRLSGPLQERARNRESYLEATAHNLLDTFVGRFLSQEEFIIGLQTRFVGAVDRDKVLALASTMTTEAVSTSSDDGFGQTVSAKAGVALKSTVPVPNPVTLRPFRTFREIEQPDSLFVLRVSPRSELGLFEADGGAWRLEAVERIARWLRVAVPEAVSVLA